MSTNHRTTDRIRNLRIEFVDGDRSARYPKRDEFVSEGILFLNAEAINQGKVDLTKANFITQEKFSQIKKGRLEEGDLILTTRGNGVGNAAYFSGKPETGLINAQMLILRPDRRVIDPRYMFYSFCTPSFQATLKNFVSGSAQPQLPIQSLREVEFSYPPLPTQRRIAAVLSAYDDLIENNARRIAILEEMAGTLYREWFVEFRFPGHERVAMVEGVPEGWEAVSVREVTSYINRGVSPKYADRSVSIVINQKCIRDSRLNLALVRRHSSNVAADKYVQFGDVLINSTGIGTLGRVAQVYQDIKDCTVDSHVSIVRPKDRVGIDYFGYYLISLQAHFDSQGIGSTGQTELGREAIARTDFLLPPRTLQDRFGELVSPIRRSIIQMFARNTNLRRTRDLLLPKLISGELDVSELEIAGVE